MKKLWFVCIAWMVSALLVCPAALAEDVIELNSGETVRGRFIDESRTEITVQTGDTKLVLPKSMIKVMKIEVAVVYLCDGRVHTGQVEEETEDSITLRMKLGGVTVDKMDVDRIEHKVVEQKPVIWKKKVRGSRGRPGASRRRRRGKTGLEDIVWPKKTEDLPRHELQRLQQRGLELLQKKRYRQAIDTYQKMLRGAPKNYLAHYNLACAYALTGKRDKAVEHLRMSVAAGYSNFHHMEHDSDFDSIRRHRDYRELIKHKDAIQLNAAKIKLEQLKQEFGEGYTYQVDDKRKLIFATNQSLEVLARLKDHLSRFAEAQWRMMWKNKPSYYLTIICPDKKKFRELIPSKNVGGVYRNGDKVLICGSIGSVLDHEFTHALNFADLDARRMFGVPIYVIEGLATVFEATGLAGQDLIPRRISWRFSKIRKSVDEGRHIPWEKFINYKQSQYSSFCYAEGRYMFVYLYEKGRLKKWYNTYCETYRKDRTGRLAWEKVFKKSLNQIEQDWIAWMKGIEYVKRKRVRDGGPYLGVDGDECPKGIAIYRVIPDSAASKGGLEEGDIMTHADGKPFKIYNDFIDFLNSHNPGDKVQISILRGKRKKKLRITLGQRPRRR